MKHYHDQELVKKTIKQIKKDKTNIKSVIKDLKRLQSDAEYEYEIIMRNPYRAPELEEENEQTLAWYNDLLAGLEE